VFLYSCHPNDKNLDPKLAVQLAKDMQALRGAEEDMKGQDLMQQNAGRRKAIRKIVKDHKSHKEKQAVGPLEDALQRRLSEGEYDKDMIHCVAV
jgi:hypothetical protein